LPDLAVESGDGCRKYDDAPLAVIDRRQLLEIGGNKAHHVKGTGEIHVDNAPKGIKGHGTGAADDFSRGRNARAGDENARGTVSAFRGGHGALGALRIGYVAGDEQSADFSGDSLTLGFIHVEDGDLRARRGQRPRGCRA
jgi:hypothetical protein